MKMEEQNKIQRIDSKTSIGFPDSGSNPENTVPTAPKVNSKEKEEVVADISNLLIHCQTHDKICVSRVASKGIWLPSIGMRLNDSWTLSANELLEKIGLKVDVFNKSIGNVINVFRIQITQTSSFVTRLTFLVIIPKDSKQVKCCTNDDKFRWISVDSVMKIDSDYFWGPEIQLWTKFWIRNENERIISQRMEYETRDALQDYCDKANPCTTDRQTMIRSACFTEKDILGVYDLFLQHCYPSQFMTFTSFKHFIRKIGLKISDNNMVATFRAFDGRQRSYLNFNQLLLGLAAMDQATEHGGQSGHIRCGYLMRFYDSDCDGFLSHSDICHMIVDIQRLNNSPHKVVYDSKKSSIEEYANQLIKAHGTNNRISLTELTKSIGSLKFRGTSGLFRAPGSTLKHAMKLLTDEKTNLLSVALVRHNKYDNICQTCCKRSYKISKQVYKMSKNGEVLSYTDLSKNMPKTPIGFVNDFPDSETFELASDLINKLHEIKKCRFDGQSTSEKTSLGNWFFPSKQILIKKLMAVCHKCNQIFEREDRVFRISTPCYIFGDIHGNLKDLMIFANDFWRMSPLLNECNYLFLGDYVDRGERGVECIMYLFALKLMSPNKFWMCRGNHEVRSLQESFTFYNECVDNYNEDIWKAINETFDRLPIAALIDSKIFCSHGGIPTDTNSIEKLQMVDHILPDPQTVAPCVWEVLWNDPMADEDFRQLTAFERREVENMNGFLPNTKRGTAFYYSELAVDNFLEHNDIQCIVRGHEMIGSGYKFLMNGKVITIFSTSLYCNQKNEASVLFVNQNKIRVIRVHTFD